MKPTKIAVAIPTYRRPELLLELTRSLPAHIPISVSDNDGSLVGLVMPFGSNVNIHHADQLLPIFVNWNRAVSLVPDDATHVLIPSDDDLYLPTAFKTINQAIEKYPSTDMIIFGCDFVDKHGNIRKGWAPEKEELCALGDGFLHFESGVNARMPGVLFRTDLLHRIGGFDERFELTASDSELIQRAALLGSTAFVPTVIGQYRIWSGSLTHARQATDQWLSEVELWTSKIAELLQTGHQPPSRQVNIERFRDEIYTRNLLTGLNSLCKKGEVENAKLFLVRHQAPRHIKLMTRLRLLRMRWRLWKATV
ncbi:hypothetical protein [Amphibiibacter pelophylacis]|uniref:Glycosyltransferase family 2 protein n=1 Tax=Amphibiibacter pelophylacis TaxID=1799477 RepID=A0ACC6P1W9_9BURK